VGKGKEKVVSGIVGRVILNNQTIDVKTSILSQKILSSNSFHCIGVLSKIQSLGVFQVK
jgi:hypothetical protein